VRKRGIIFLMTFLVLAIYSRSQGAEIFHEFSYDSLEIDGSLNIRYRNLSTVTVNDSLALPVYTFYLETKQTPKPNDFFTDPGFRSIIGYIPENLRHFDSSITGQVEIGTQNYPDFKLDFGNTVFDLHRVIVAGRPYTAISLLPVTLDSSGYLIFNGKIMFESSVSAESMKSTPAVIDELGDSYTGSVQSFAYKEGQVYGLPLGCEYVIITTPALSSAFDELANFKSATGISTQIALLDSIYTQYSGVDESEKIRNYLIDFYQSGGQYVLLGGDDITVPARYVYYYNTSMQDIDPYYLRPSDLYYADIDGIWEVDGDGIWGEPTDDNPDLTPELMVGRLPVNNTTAINNYVRKLINYSTNPGNGDFAYLTKAFFFSSDQMRDYPAGGQHNFIGQEIPDFIHIDSVFGVEYPSGIDPDPTNASGEQCIDKLSEGFGFVHILAHGRIDGFVIRSANYGDWPASLLLARPQTYDNGDLSKLEKNNRTGLYYSLACDGGAFDLDSANGNSSDWSFAERLISADSAGAVALVANARWGWVYSSYYLQAAFTRNLYGAAEGSPIKAMYYSWIEYPYYRDLIYGQNYLGDPTLKIYTKQPQELSLDIPKSNIGQLITIISSGVPVSDAIITISDSSGVMEQGLTDNNGQYQINVSLNDQEAYTLTASKDGYTVLQELFVPSITLDVDDGDDVLPVSYKLEQNYPNPFNPSTSIAYSLPERTDIVIEIFNILGQSVRSYSRFNQSAGRHILEWDGKDKSGLSQSSGVYFYRMVAGGYTETRKMLMVK